MPEEMGLLEAIYSLRAIRRYRPEPVPEEHIRTVIDAATRAASGGNRQPWAFLVIRDAELKRRMGEYYLDAWRRTYGLPERRHEYEESEDPRMWRTYQAADHLAHHLAEVPVLILVCACGVTPGSGASWGGSIYPAVQNLMLAARGLGLGTVLTSLHKLHERDIKEILGIPDDVETAALIPLGYPRGRFGPVRRIPAHEVTHYDRWGNSPSWR